MRYLGVVCCVLCAAPTRVCAVTGCDLAIVLFMEKDSAQPTLF